MFKPRFISTIMLGKKQKPRNLISYKTNMSHKVPYNYYPDLHRFFIRLFHINQDWFKFRRILSKNPYWMKKVFDLALEVIHKLDKIKEILNAQVPDTQSNIGVQATNVPSRHKKDLCSHPREAQE